MEDKIDESSTKPLLQQHKSSEKQNKKTMSKFQLGIMIKIGAPLGFAILVVGVMNNLIVFYSFSHIMKISQHIFIDNETFTQNSQNYQQSKTVSNQVQMIVTALHQLNNVNKEQVSLLPSGLEHCYPQQYKVDVKDQHQTANLKNCVCNTTPLNCAYTYPYVPDYADNIPVCNPNPTSTPKWFETDIKSSSRTPNQYVYYAPINTDAQYNQIRIARLIYKTMKKQVDFIRITHQSGVEMLYSENDVSGKYTCSYNPLSDTVFKKTQAYQQRYSKNLVEHVFIDESESSIDRKIKTTFCLQLSQMVYCQVGLNTPCGQICIQSSTQISSIEKILGKTVIIDSQKYFLVGSQENSNYQVINLQNKDQNGKMYSFQWLYTVLFGQDPTKPFSTYAWEFHNKFGINYYPYQSNKRREDYEIQAQGYGQYYSKQNQSQYFSYSYVRVNQDYEDPNNRKIVYTLMSEFNIDNSLSLFNEAFIRSSDLNTNWIWVGVITCVSFLLCFFFLKSFASSLANPIIELTCKVKQIKEGNLDINLLVDFQYSFEEVNQLYEELEEVNLQIKYSTDKFYDGKSDAENLINLTNAVCVYSKLKNQKILGIILNNLGNVHARNQRYQEAIACFRKAVKIAEKELRRLVRFDYPEIFYKATRVSGWKDFLQYREPASPLGWLDEDEKIFKVNEKKLVRVNMKLKKKLEEIFCNRLFSLANVLILQGELEYKEKVKLVYFEEAIDHLNLVECIDKYLDHARSRSIKIYFKLSQAYISRAKLTNIQEDWFEGVGQLEKAAGKFNYYETIHNLFRVEILKRKFQMQQYDENMSVRKSRIQSDSFSSPYQTNKLTSNTDDSFLQFNSRRNNPMLIEMHLFQSPYQTAAKKRQQPHPILGQYQRYLNRDETELNVIIDDPPEILKSELMLNQGFVHYEFGVFDKSLNFLTKGIEEGRQFNPDIRRECLKVINNIFEKQLKMKQETFQKESRENQDSSATDKAIQEIQKYLKVIKQMIQETEIKGKKDLIFLVDTSETMSNKKSKAIEAFQNIKETYLKDLDRLAFVKFNHNIDVVFELQVRGKNDKFIDKFLKDEKQQPCFGDKALYNAIYEGIKLFQKAEPTLNSRWLVAITDDVDNYSRIDEEQLKPLFFQNNVKLIVIGLNLKNSAKEVYSKVCKSTGGTFIESPHSQDLNVAFQAITKLQFATDQQANYVDEKFD